jgi:hypothetical protein
MKFLRYIWALPNTLLGLLFLPLAVLTKGGVQAVGGVLEIYGGFVSFVLRHFIPPRGEVAALTLGHVVLGRDKNSLAASRLHERAHVRQYEVFGPAFLFVYLAASILAMIRGEGAYQGNYLEKKAMQREKVSSGHSKI